MSASEKDALLSRWIQPSSQDEQAQQDRAERMVRDAIESSDAIDTRTVSIYTKGSYPNNTNVRRDSDVDVVVQQNACQYFDHLVDQPQPDGHHSTPYTGPWTPSAWRVAVTRALTDYFGFSSVDTTGRVAINIGAVAGSRPSADVVPSFNYVRYDDQSHWNVSYGSCVFPTEGSGSGSGSGYTVNWPQQQLDNGRTFNRATGGRYKNYTRALKNAENALSAEGVIDDLPSYLMECIMYNAPSDRLKYGSLTGGFEHTLVWLYQQLDSGTARENWVEPNDIKPLFKGHQKWTPDDAKTLVARTWGMIYGD